MVDGGTEAQLVHRAGSARQVHDLTQIEPTERQLRPLRKDWVMHITRRTFLRSSATGLTAVAVPGLSSPALAQNAPIRISVLYDFSGPLAAAGSLASAFGVQIAIDL